MLRLLTRRVAAWALCALLLPPAEASVTDERRDFLAAESALKRGDRATFQRLSANLERYPLHAYLWFLDLKGRLTRTSDEEVAQFLDAHPDTPLADRIRRAWLGRLAAEGRWQAYTRFYAPDDSTERLCHYLHGLIRTGRLGDAFSQIEPLWLSGHSQPDACDPVFNAWRRAGALTPELTWKRIALAMDRDNNRLAAYLGRFLPEQEGRWLTQWLAIHRRPEQLIDAAGLEGPDTLQAAVLAHGLRRLAERQPRAASEAWDRLQPLDRLPEELAARVDAAIGFGLAEEGDREGLAYLARIPARKDNLPLQDRRLRTALRFDAWPEVADWVRSMPPGEHRSEHWLYWLARALTMSGDSEPAAQAYREAARERGLWGFLSAERIGAPYHLGHVATPVSEELLSVIEQSPAGRRIAELRALGRDVDARREMYRLGRDMEQDQLMAAAVLASRWGWPDRAIIALAQSGYWDDLELRFPTAHRDLVRDRARANGLDESWVFAVMRQESIFNPQAVSPAGALGLMQLMPKTARSVALSLGVTVPRRLELLEPALNIRLGSAYLARMQKRFGGNPVVAAAAYNAGPGRVRGWLPREPQEADLWVATIPFRETRTYVRRVLAYRLIYDHRLGKEIRSLSAVMRPVARNTASVTEERAD